MYLLSQSLYYEYILTKQNLNIFDRTIIRIVALNGNPSALYDSALYTCKEPSDSKCEIKVRNALLKGHPFSFPLLAKIELNKQNPDYNLSAALIYIFGLYQVVDNTNEANPQYGEYALLNAVSQDILKQISQYTDDALIEVKKNKTMNEIGDSWINHCKKNLRDPYCIFQTVQ